MTLPKLHHNRRGFTLVEIMIVVAIIALLAAIAVPNFLRARKRSQATRILEDLRLLDNAISLYAIEHNKSPSQLLMIDYPDLKMYIKEGTRLYNMPERDFLGHFQFGTTDIGEPRICVSNESFNELSDVAPLEFWSPWGPDTR